VAAADAVPRLRPNGPWLRLWQAGLLLGIALLVVHDVAGVGRTGNVFFDRWLYDGVEFAAGIGCVVRAALVRSERWASFALGAALVLSTTGDVIYDFAYGGNPPFPSAADIFYLAFYPGCYIGLGLLLRARVSRFSASLWLDGLMAGLAAAALGSSLILNVVVSSTHGRPLVVLTNVAYPLGDIVLLSMVAFVFAIHGMRPGRVWWLVAAGLVLNTVGDGIYLYQSALGTYVEGTWLDALWPSSLVLLAFSTWHTTAGRGRASLEQHTLTGTPVACGLIAAGVLVAADVDHHVHPLAIAFAAATIVLILVRTGLTFRENAILLNRSRVESLTDALTGLGNRRRLLADLADLFSAPRPIEQRLLVIFDLNGFKDYNDTFGHPAGDALLGRLAGKLAAAVVPDGRAYRMGGDEFCALLPASETSLDRAARALHEEGESFTVSSAFGAVEIPAETEDASTALSIADERLYRHKEQQTTRRGSAHELLLRTLAEREPGLREHVAGVATLAVAVGERLGLGGNELDELRLAAELHDVGKLAVPDAVLQKPAPLDDAEWAFIRKHTLIGQRILAGVNALTGVGRIVRSTHENWDGTGYPDGLAGEQIPLAARIITACDAFSTITSERPYRAARTATEAAAELRRCAGTQFEPAIVTALCELLTQGLPLATDPEHVQA
jgi:diguanylate cyclase (GGDEF)-like protein